MSTSRKAVELILKYERDRGFKPLDVSRNRTFIGYDIISRGPDDEVRLIEVKGTSHEWGIPDMVDTEFTPRLTLLATHLYVVGNITKTPKLYIVPRKDLKPEYLEKKITYHVKRAFQNQLPEKYFIKVLNSV